MIFGPTSVYSKCSAKSSGIIKDTAKLPISRVRIKVMLEITVSFLFFDRFPRSFLNHNLYDSICPFFAWQYTSYYLSIYRQSLLFHFLQKDFSNDFVSEELIYVLVALGAKNSFDNSLSKHTYEYYNHSKRNLLEDSTNKNSAFSSASVKKP
ncbi:APG_G0018030.mRNA.1.CDS.1 [Saccharomyces cerevisiae]|nr:APG_G0018030.mRNA.1.CDS.1 [Saccharomyces cerevisiae]CAI7112511.1 APG_G0018030.mRNA.1.CDS.1 [Saccharomyces cerevisiae]